MNIRHFLDLSAIDGATLRAILDESARLKALRRKDGAPKPLAGKMLAMIFDSPSTRTRVSFDVGMRELGGETLLLTGQEMQLGRGETIADTAKVLSRYVDAIVIRALDAALVAELAANATIPVINGLTKLTHPCQVMADILTFEEHKGPIAGRAVAWMGDANNVLASWVHAAGRFNFSLSIASPPELAPKPALIKWAKENGAAVTVTTDAEAAAAGADCIVTDTWVSMGDRERERRHNLLQPYQVNNRVMALAKPDAIFMHCLPAHRGEEVTAEVIDGPNSVVFDEAENRLHAQKGILAWCLEKQGVMSVEVENTEGAPALAGDDKVRPFSVASLDLRGRAIQMGPVLDAILERHAYPPAVSKLLAEAIVLGVLLGSSLKFDGKFILQTETDGPVDMLVVDFRTSGDIRAYARFDAERVSAAEAAGAVTPGGLLGKGVLAMTIDQGPNTSRYQGVVPLEGGTLEDVAHTYFRQSEQIPTKVRLAVAEMQIREGGALLHRWRAGGLLAQFLPASEDRMRQQDLPGGDAPEGAAVEEVEEDDFWVEAQSLVGTVEDHELTDPAVPVERLLYRLFHERGVRVHRAAAVRDQCSCSRQKIADMLKGFTAEEITESTEDGAITVTCEFCGTKYDFDPADFSPQ